MDLIGNNAVTIRDYGTFIHKRKLVLELTQRGFPTNCPPWWLALYGYLRCVVHCAARCVARCAVHCVARCVVRCVASCAWKTLDLGEKGGKLLGATKMCSLQTEKLSRNWRSRKKCWCLVKVPTVDKKLSCNQRRGEDFLYSMIVVGHV